MAYEYRRLTPEERKAVVHLRMMRRYPLHGPPHPYRHAGCYSITAANFEHQPIMATIERRTEFEIRLLTELAEAQIVVFAWIVLANHYHLLVRAETLHQISMALKQLHGLTSYQWNVADGLTGKRRVWYQFRDRVIRDDTHFYRVMNYIHYNAVQHSYVDSPYDWPWSSIDKYLESYGREWLRTTWQTYPPLDFEHECDKDVPPLKP